MAEPPTIAVIGGGFIGAAVAYHLARAGTPARLLAFEPRARVGGSLACGGEEPVHRFNVPATRMCLLPEDSNHFAHRLDETGALAGGEASPRRREFGRTVASNRLPRRRSLTCAGRGRRPC